MSTPTYSKAARRARITSKHSVTGEVVEPIELMIQRIINGLNDLEYQVAFRENRVAMRVLVQEVMEQAQNTLIRSMDYREKRAPVGPMNLRFADGGPVGDYGLGFAGDSEGVRVRMVFEGEYCEVGVPVQEAFRLNRQVSEAVVEHMEESGHPGAANARAVQDVWDIGADSLEGKD